MSSIAIFNVIWIALRKRLAIIHISDHVPIAVGFSWGRASLVSLIKGEAPFNGNYESYFGPDCIIFFKFDFLFSEIVLSVEKPRNS